MIEYNNTTYITTSSFIRDALDNGEDYEYVLSRLKEIGIDRYKGLIMIEYAKGE